MQPIADADKILVAMFDQLQQGKNEIDFLPILHGVLAKSFPVNAAGIFASGMQYAVAAIAKHLAERDASHDGDGMAIEITGIGTAGNPTKH